MNDAINNGSNLTTGANNAAGTAGANLTAGNTNAAGGNLAGGTAAAGNLTDGTTAGGAVGATGALGGGVLRAAAAGGVAGDGLADSGMVQDNYVSGAPLTTENAAVVSADLLTASIDKAVTKIRPMATPLDQISRLGHVRSVDAMRVDYYSVDTRGDRDRLVSFEVSRNTEGTEEIIYAFEVEHPSRFEVSDTFAMSKDLQSTLYYIISKGADGKMQCVQMGTPNSEPAAGDEIIRMGRAATQLDVQSPQFSALPTKRTNYCQIFKMQVEQSVIMKLSHKEVGWSFTDQQEAAIYDMRLGMEKQFLFGKMGRVYDHLKGETVTFTGGIWNQAGKEINVKLEGFDNKALVDMLCAAFSENSGSRRKVLLAGRDLISALNKLEGTRVITARDQVTKWGIDFSELQSKFGKLYVLYSDIFDTMGMPGNGMVIDPEYVVKHVFIPFRADVLDLRGSGQRNTEAVVLTEASCLTLRYPEAHARILGN